MLYLPVEKIFLDPTIDHTAPKQLPPGDEGASVLIIGRAAGLQTVPFAKPASIETTGPSTFESIGWAA